MAMAVIGCTVMTDGKAVSDSEDAPAYRTSASSSVAASAATSSIRASERAAAETTKAIHSVCETMAISSAEAVSNVNTYVAAVNGDGDVEASKQPAIDALNNSADTVEPAITAKVTGELRDSLSAWVTSSRATAGNIAAAVDPVAFNTSVATMNSARQRALELCDATYR
ncbi:hypothetical protein AWC04_19485 [Mycolicibacterium fallax]|uniref:Uncharacterized protein n=1 Tax=Mycolicibacterium fallax TaxID=1793 RepID=A0A1X1QZB5_MYCFA|nr:hypothetical protein AWC04_19485 [Mycolicibacterium fallax]